MESGAGLKQASRVWPFALGEGVCIARGDAIGDCGTIRAGRVLGCSFRVSTAYSTAPDACTFVIFIRLHSASTTLPSTPANSARLYKAACVNSFMKPLSAGGAIDNSCAFSPAGDRAMWRALAAMAAHKQQHKEANQRLP